jgi:lipoprotein-anchoring transpeptidase ErfK/SrfK
MCNFKKSLSVLSLILVFSLLLLPVCVAASKSPKAQKAQKVSDKTQKIEAVPTTSQKATKAPDTVQNSETNPSTSRIAKAYADIIKSEPLLIIVEKSKYKLYLFKDGTEIKNYDVAVGKNPGQKQRVNDKTTPTGMFKVDEIIASSNWTHDFNDGNGEIEGAYGPWFVSLETGWDGIGIHGTHDPSSIGTMVSEGCIRMNNGHVSELKELISIGAKVVVE